MWNTKIIEFIDTQLHGSDAMFKETPYYRGDVTLRKSNLNFDLTNKEREVLDEIRDPFIFSSYCKYMDIVHGYGWLQLRDYQKDLIRTVQKNRFVCVAHSRQMGMTIMQAFLILHFATTNTDKTAMYLTTNNESAADFITKFKMLYAGLPFYMKPGIVSWNAKSVEFDNGCKIIAKGASGEIAVGRTVSLVCIDNASHIKESLKMYRSIGPTIEAVDDSRILIFATPNGYNWFYDMYSKATEGMSGYVSRKYKWNLIPTRDENWKMNEIKNIGQDRFDEENELLFSFKQPVVNIDNNDVDAMLDNSVHKMPTLEWLAAEVHRLNEKIKSLEEHQWDGR